MSGLTTTKLSHMTTLFLDNELAPSIARHGGLTAIRYYGAQRFGDTGFFQADPISA